jgi:hypothetical protein
MLQRPTAPTPGPLPGLLDEEIVPMLSAFDAGCVDPDGIPIDRIVD